MITARWQRNEIQKQFNCRFPCFTQIKWTHFRTISFLQQYHHYLPVQEIIRYNSWAEAIGVGLVRIGCNELQIAGSKLRIAVIEDSSVRFAETLYLLWRGRCDRQSNSCCHSDSNPPLLPALLLALLPPENSLSMTIGCERRFFNYCYVKGKRSLAERRGKALLEDRAFDLWLNKSDQAKRLCSQQCVRQYCSKIKKMLSFEPSVNIRFLLRVSPTAAFQFCGIRSESVSQVWCSTSLLFVFFKERTQITSSL